jgi:uncharacterized membrane protein
MKTPGFLVCFLLQLFATSCAKDKTNEPENSALPKSCSANYGKDIRPMLITKCSSEKCHTTNFTFGDFNSYDDLKTRIDNGKFNQLVFEFELMPPKNSTQLSPQELETLKCWINNGAQKN